MSPVNEINLKEDKNILSTLPHIAKGDVYMHQ